MAILEIIALGIFGFCVTLGIITLIITATNLLKELCK